MAELNSAQWAEALEGYAQLIELPEAERQQALASWPCSDDTIRTQMGVLLGVATQLQEARFLDSPFSDWLERSGLNMAGHRAGTVLGNYRLERQLGSGGMGEVWLAARADGLYQGQVALKILHGHLHSPVIKERFLQEAAILAKLAHPHIARLLDAGATAQGQLYLVLEHVAGEPLDQWCEARDLDINARLALLQQVVQALSFAHAHLVVHRDLKPSNILVTLDGSVKLLDFGIAKLVDPGKQAELTQSGQRVFTPEYAAPEQRREGNITTLTDVYALGMLSYRLLAGRLPFDALPQECRAFPLMSQRAEPLGLGRRLAGDLDNIVAKAIAVEPTERYPSVVAMSEDIQRHLQHQPIMAKAPGAWLRASKFLRRNRLAVGVSALLISVVVTGTGAVAWQAHQAHLAANVANVQRERAEQVKGFLVSVFSEMDPLSRMQPEQRSPQQLVQRAVARLQNEFDNQPALRAELYGDLGEIQFNLGDFDASLAVLKKGLAEQRLYFGDKSLAVARTLYRLAAVRFALDQRVQAEQNLSEALGILDILGAIHGVDAAQVKARLASFMARREGVKDSTLALINEAYRDALAVDDAPGTLLADIQSLRGDMLWRARFTEQAKTALLNAIDLYQQYHGNAAIVLWKPFSSLGRLQSSAGHFDDALASYDHALGLLSPYVNGLSHQVAGLLLDKGNVYQRMGKFDLAEADYEQAEQRMPADADELMRRLLSERAELYFQMGDGQQAELYYRRAYQLKKATLGQNSFSVPIAASEWGRALAMLGQTDKALALQKDALVRVTRLEGPDAYHNCLVLDALAQTLVAAGYYAEAAGYQRRALQLTRMRYSQDHKVWAERAWLLVKSLAAQPGPDTAKEALPLLARSIKVLRALDSNDNRLAFMAELQQRLARQALQPEA